MGIFRRITAYSLASFLFAISGAQAFDGNTVIDRNFVRGLAQAQPGFVNLQYFGDCSLISNKGRIRNANVSIVGTTIRRKERHGTVIPCVMLGTLKGTTVVEYFVSAKPCRASSPAQRANNCFANLMLTAKRTVRTVGLSHNSSPYTRQTRSEIWTRGVPVDLATQRPGPLKKRILITQDFYTRGRIHTVRTKLTTFAPNGAPTGHAPKITSSKLKIAPTARDSERSMQYDSMCAFKGANHAATAIETIEAVKSVTTDGAIAFLPVAAFHVTSVKAVAAYAVTSRQLGFSAGDVVDFLSVVHRDTLVYVSAHAAGMAVRVTCMANKATELPKTDWEPDFVVVNPDDRVPVEARICTRCADWSTVQSGGGADGEFTDDNGDVIPLIHAVTEQEICVQWETYSC